MPAWLSPPSQTLLFIAEYSFVYGERSSFRLTAADRRLIIHLSVLPAVISMAPFIPRPPKPPKIPIATSFSSIPLLSGVKNAIAPRCGAQGIRTRNRDATATNGARPAPRMADDSQTGITRIALTSKHVVRHSQSERSLSENCNRRRLLFSNLGFVHPSLGSLRLTSTTTAQLRRTPNPTRIGARTLCSTSSASSKQEPNCGALELSQSPEDESGIDDEALLVDSEWTRLFQGMIPLR